MTKSSRITLTGKAAGMLNFCQPSKYVLLGVGKILSWPVEGTPPLIELSTYQVPELAFFVQTTLTYGLISDELGNIILPDGTSYTKTDVLNAEEIVFSNAFNLLIEATIPHNLLPSLVNSYRAFGVYTNCTFYNNSSLENSIIPINEVAEKTLDTLIFFPPVVKQLNLVEQVKIIRSFL